MDCTISGYIQKLMIDEEEEVKNPSNTKTGYWTNSNSTEFTRLILILKRGLEVNNSFDDIRSLMIRKKNFL